MECLQVQRVQEVQEVVVFLQEVVVIVAHPLLHQLLQLQMIPLTHQPHMVLLHMVLLLFFLPHLIQLHSVFLPVSLSHRSL